MYYIWRRNDGVLGATTYSPQSWTTSAGRLISFEILEVSASWTHDIVSKHK